MIATDTIDLQVEDFTGQIKRRARGIPKAASVADLIESFRGELQLPDQDAQGSPIQYGALSGGDVLNATDLVGEVLTDNAVVQLTKSVTAG